MAKNQLKSLKECKTKRIQQLVKELQYLLSLNASQNQAEEIDFADERGKLEYLQNVNLAQNLIKEIPQILLPNLLSLSLTGNAIFSAAKFNGHPTLKKLELRKNKLTSFQGIRDLPHLQELFAAENELTTLEGLENLPALKTLHIRKNPVCF